MAFTIQARVEGVEQAVKSLDDLGRTVKNRILRKAVRAGARVIVTGAKTKVRTRTKLLKKSLTLKLKAYRSSGVMVAIIGPKTGMKKQVGTRARGVHTGQAYYEDPAKIAHLVERGHQRGKGRSAAPAYPFLGSTLDETKGQVATAVKDVIAREIEATAGK